MTGGPPRRHPARTPLFAALQRAARLGRSRPAGPPMDERIAMAAVARPMPRRDALKLAGLAAAGLLVPQVARAGPSAAATARVAVVGAGVAGLNAAWRLGRAGIPATVFEATSRAGGRMYTATDLVGPGLTTELGGEFIDTGHTDLLALVETFALATVDRQGPAEAGLRAGFFFGGRLRTDAEITAAFAPLATRIGADVDRLDTGDDRYTETLDRLSIAGYLDHIGASGWIRDLLDAAYVAEYGLDPGEQSALNLVALIGTAPGEGFAVYGDSDERFRVVGGNERIPAALAAHLPDVRTDHELAAVRPAGRRLNLVFHDGPTVREAAFDAVVLAVPFATLRRVDLSAVDLPARKRRAIAELGYGTNAKLFAGVASRPWRAMGHHGECVADAAFGLCWDHTQGQPGPAGGLTLFSGGAEGLAVGRGTAGAQVARLMPGVEAAFPGTLAAQTGVVGRFHWPTAPFARGSYSCYRPGQWTEIAGAEAPPVGRLFFAGEHCSDEHQGYMNGAAESGRLAAKAVVNALG